MPEVDDLVAELDALIDADNQSVDRSAIANRWQDQEDNEATDIRAGTEREES